MTSSRIPLIDSVDAIVERLVALNARNLARWGTPCTETNLASCADLTFDGRRVRRNWDLVEALAADPRVVVSHPKGGINFAEVRVALKAI